MLVSILLWVLGPASVEAHHFSFGHLAIEYFVGDKNLFLQSILGCNTFAE
jgi:hypothetical protein